MCSDGKKLCRPMTVTLFYSQALLKRHCYISLILERPLVQELEDYLQQIYNKNKPV